MDLVMDVGARLRHAREERGLTLDRLSRLTRVTLPILKAIEQNNQGAIPPRPYGRGFVRTYASEVGLDPEQIVHDFFSQFAPVPAPSLEPTETSIPEPSLHPAEARSPRRVGLMLTWMVAAVLAIVMVGWSWRRAGAPEAVGTSGHSTPPAAATLGTTTPAATPAAPSTTGVTISLEATGPSWVTAVVDGRRVIYRMLQPGEREVLRGQQEITIRTGDAGALRWHTDGRPGEAMGKAGEVRTVRITPVRSRPR
jgi:cytoskeletal protein RodZ